MSRSIGKGSRFLVLSGKQRGLAGTVADSVSDGRWILDVDGGRSMLETTADLEGPAFKRLADAPAEVDPLFAEIAAHDIGKRGSDGPQSTLDEIRWAGTIPDHDLDIASDDPFRAALVEIAALALAGIRAIDGR